MKLNFRIIGKFGFLLVIFGFFQPISCQMNGFQLAKYMNVFGNPLISILIYFVLLSAIVGCIIGILLLMKKTIKISYDWICLLFCVGCGLFVFFISLNSEEVRLQSGAYFILIGWIITLIAQLKYNDDKNELKTFFFGENTKICPFCANKIKEEAVICQYCGKDLPINTDNRNISNKNDISIECNTMAKGADKLIRYIIIILIIILFLILKDHISIPTSNDTLIK
jgi:hypothetical protein